MNSSTFKSRLVDARAAKGLSQAELSRMADVAPGQISRYELGLNMPRPHIIGRLAGALGVHPEWLHKGEGPRESGSTTAHGKKLDVTVEEKPDGRPLISVGLDDEASQFFEKEAAKEGVPIGKYLSRLLIEQAIAAADEKLKTGSNPELERLRDELAQTRADLKKLAEAVIRLGNSAE